MSQQNIIIIILGKKGSGKSYLAKKLFLPKFERVIILDSQNEYTPSDDLEKRLASDLIYVKDFDEFESEYLARYTDKSFRIVLQYENFSEPDNYLNDLEDTFDLINTCGYCTLLLEEIHLFSSRGKDALYRLITTGRHKNINLVATTPRPQRLGVDFFANADIVITFTQRKTGDAEYLIRECSDEDFTVKQFQKLKDREYLVIQGNDIFQSNFRSALELFEISSV